MDSRSTISWSCCKYKRIQVDSIKVNAILEGSLKKCKVFLGEPVGLQTVLIYYLKQKNWNMYEKIKRQGRQKKEIPHKA